MAWTLKVNGVLYDIAEDKRLIDYLRRIWDLFPSKTGAVKAPAERVRLSPTASSLKHACAAFLKWTASRSRRLRG